MEESRIQHLQPVAFADNFMRTADEHDAWALQSGDWHLQSAWDEDSHGNDKRFSYAAYALNPFAWVGRNPDGAALCSVGKAYWEDYTMTVAIQPAQSGAAGVVVNMPDLHHGLLVRWSAANDHGPRGNALTLYRLEDKQLAPLASSPGGYVPGRWYRLSVVSTLDGLRVLIDGCERLSVAHATPCRGGVGLYAEGSIGTVFNNVTVYGHTLHTESHRGKRADPFERAFPHQPIRLQKWARMQEDWTRFLTMPTALCYQYDCSGDHWIMLRVRKSWIADRPALAGIVH